MKFNYFTFISFLIICVLVSSCETKNTTEQKSLLLWFDQPAAQWDNALPIGNGRIGAMVIGNPITERIQVNEESLWGGSKISNDNPGALENLPEIRQKILAGEIPKAFDLAEKHIAGIPGKLRSYQVLGDIYLHFTDTLGEITDYRRELNLETGIIKISFTRKDNHIEYELFSSAVDDVIALKLESSKPNGLDMGITMTRVRDAEINIVDNALEMIGQVIDDDEPILGPGGDHMKFYAKLLPISFNGNINTKNDTLILKGGDEALLLFGAATDYNINGLNFDRTIDPKKVTNDLINNASKKTYNALKNDHILEHASKMNKVIFELTDDNSLDSLPTDKRLEKFKSGKNDPGLIETYFQFGRYLLLGSSRKPAQLPANLQGIWNKDWWAPWCSDYHVNINIQMNYWPAEVCNLSETVDPLINFMKEITIPGSATAKNVYGANGWTVHHTTDVFGKTSVIDGVYWGMFPMGGPWMTFPIWRHFEFTCDTNYLREIAYPILKGSAEFIETFVFEDNEGFLVTAPSYSPENSYIDPKSGKEFKLTYAPTMDIQIIKEVLTNTQKAAAILEIDEEFSKRLQNTLDKLPPVRVASNGTIMEWIKEYEEFEPGHRHISHLLGLHPGTQISAETPELFEAAAKTLDKRLAHGGGHTGWSRAWIINFYARLLDGEEAYKHLRLLLEKSTLPNLFDTHPPFQIDGNFGGTAGIAEMLIQSHLDKIHLLPAIPDVWDKGKITGLKTRGNFEVDMEWESNMLKQVKIKSLSGNPLKIKYLDKEITFDTKKDEIIVMDGKLEKLN
ncbi:glycoside hydrolase N-terminal domain-containing protein [Bacteroidota bacterium]